jgi:hypothetical protein
VLYFNIVAFTEENFFNATWIEDGLVLFAFTPNDQGEGWEILSDNKVREWVKLACINLQQDSWVAFASPGKVIPDEDVIEARPWKNAPDWAMGKYEFRRTKCENSNGSSDLHVVEATSSCLSKWQEAERRGPAYFTTLKSWMGPPPCDTP